MLTHHKFLNKWLQLGGHLEEDQSFIGSAIRESIEESGIKNIKPVINEILDIDIHEIPENVKKNEPKHFHYDIRYLLQSDIEDFIVSDESNALEWMNFNDAKKYSEASMGRMINKIMSVL